jgi:integrase
MRWSFRRADPTRTPSPVFQWAKKKRDEATGVSGWRLHDLRRTVSTGMAHLKVRVEVVEKLLNHSTGTLGGVAGVYNRFAYMDEMRDAVERWAEYIDELISGAAEASA